MHEHTELNVRAAGAEMPARTYLLGGHPLVADTSTGQALLAQAYRQRERPHCSCMPSGAPMYIARAGGRLIVKRMPETGSLHAPGCGSYAPSSRLGLHAFGGAVHVNPDTGQTLLRLGFRLECSASTRGGLAVQAGSVVSSPLRLTLRALLDYLWDEADLVAWSPGMTGRRHWGLVAWLLRREISTAYAGGHPLAERVYVPEPFRPEHKAVLSARRQTAWQHAAARPGRTQQLMVLIAEVKAIAPARYGHKLILKHLPDAPLFLGEGLHRRLIHQFGREIDMWQADEQGHLIVIATFAVGRGGSAVAEDVALMPTTAQWLPYGDPYAKVLLDTLVDRHRRFRTTLRFLSPPVTDLPVAVLTDCHEPHALHVRRAAQAPNEQQWLAAEVHQWAWDVGAPLPPLPPAARPHPPARSSPALDPPGWISTARAGD